MFTRHKFSVACCLVLMSASVAFAKQDSVTLPDKQHVLYDKFVVVKTVKAIPKPVLKNLIGDAPLSDMADPNQPYQVSDALSGPERLPFQRLVFAALSKKYCLVYNEHGGIAYGTNVSWYRLSNGKASLVWKAALREPKPSKNLSELRSVLAKGQYYTLFPNSTK